MTNTDLAKPAGERPIAPSGRWRRWLLGAVLLLGLGWIVIHRADLAAFSALLRRAQPLWLTAAVALQLATYAAVAQGWSLVARRQGVRLAFWRLAPVAITKLFADQAIPAAGFGGDIVLVDQLMRLGLSRPVAVAAVIVSLVGYYAAYALFALLTLVLLWLRDDATPVLAGLVTALLVVALAIPAGALWLRRRGPEALPQRLARLGPARSFLEAMAQAPQTLVNDRRLIASVGLCNGLVFLLDAATLQTCLLALGWSGSFSTALIAVVIASIVVTLGPIPLGLGSFEASATAMLHLLGTPLEAALAATLLLRLLTLWLPMGPGMLMLQASRRRSPPHGAKPRRAEPAATVERRSQQERG